MIVEEEIGKNEIKKIKRVVKEDLKMKKIIVSLMVSFLIIFISTLAFAETSAKNYLILKLGIYKPMSDEMTGNSESESPLGFNFGTGITGAIGYGRYLTDNLALEGTIGYARLSQSAYLHNGSLLYYSPDATLQMIPILANLKYRIPFEIPNIGRVEPFVEAGLGVYLSLLSPSGLNDKSSANLGGQIGLGADYDITKEIFVGLEALYIFVKADYDYTGDSTKSYPVNNYGIGYEQAGYDYSPSLNGLTFTVNLGYRF